MSKESRRGTRSHGNPSRSSGSSRSSSSQRSSSGQRSSSTRSSSARTSSTRSRSQSSGATSTATKQRAIPRERPVARERVTSRAQAPSPFESLAKSVISSVWNEITMTFKGDVPEKYRSNKISSTDAHKLVKRRLRFAVAGFSVALLVIAGRVILLQTVQRDGYYEASVNQRTRVNIIRATRGVIFDRNGNELALSVPSTTVYADPRDIVDPVGTARALAAVLGYMPDEEAKLAEKLAQPGSKFHYIARELTKDEAAVLLNLNLPGIYSYTEPARQIEGGVAGAVIGRTDPDGVGTSGLEKQYNTMLIGVDGKSIREVDKNGRSIAGVGKTTLTPIAGDDLVLTIDKTVQYHTDAALLDRISQLGAKGGTAIVMNSATGEIYAMSNVRRDATGAAVIAKGNYAAVEAYEPGSVAKVFSISAAMNEGTISSDTIFSVPGATTIDGFPIRDAWPHPTMDMDIRTIFSESSNIGTMLAGQTISSEKLHDYYSAFGFGRTTGLNYPGESRGILRDAKKWRGTEKYTVTYGYGLATTALQLVAGVNTVANKGVYVEPRLVKATIDKAGKRKEATPSDTRPVLTEATATTMTELMRQVVCSGTGELAKVKGMEIAGKTGTGYKVQDNGTYATDSGARRYFASFVGFFPARNPQITMLISVDEPSADSRDRFGGTAAAPVFARLVPTVMRELGIESTGSSTGCKAGAVVAGH